MVIMQLYCSANKEADLNELGLTKMQRLYCSLKKDNPAHTGLHVRFARSQKALDTASGLLGSRHSFFFKQLVKLLHRP